MSSTAPTGCSPWRLPPERVFTAQGGHDWRTWRRLWTEWLARGPLPRAATATQ